MSNLLKIVQSLKVEMKSSVIGACTWRVRSIDLLSTRRSRLTRMSCRFFGLGWTTSGEQNVVTDFWVLSYSKDMSKDSFVLDDIYSLIHDHVLLYITSIIKLLHSSPLVNQQLFTHPVALVAITQNHYCNHRN